MVFIWLPPNNFVDTDSFKDEILDRVPSVFLLLGTIYGVTQLIAVGLITTPIEEDVASNMPLVSQEKKDDNVNAKSRNEGLVSDTEKLSEKNNEEMDDNLRPSQIIKSKEFWILWLTFFLCDMGGAYINAMYYKAFGLTFIMMTTSWPILGPSQPYSIVLVEFSGDTSVTSSTTDCA